MQILPAPRVPSAKETDVAPAVAVSVPAGQVNEAVLSAMLMPAGKASVKARLLTGVAEPELSIVRVSIEVLPGPTVSGLNVLVKAGCARALVPNEINSIENRVAVKWRKFTISTP